MELKGKRVIITGASSGIGLEIVKLLLEKDCTVVAAARQIEKAGLSGSKLYLKKCDVSKRDEIDELFSFSIEKMGGIDLFIANAGFAYYERIESPDWEHIDAIFNTNIISLVYCAEKAKKITNSDPYNFVAIARGMSLLSLPGYSLYSSTKAAIKGFADAYRFELEKGQHFQVVYPIATRTNFFRYAG
jgi:short-subunit dehydrogenase